MANGRCRLHGGRSTGPKSGHGIYADGYTDEELELEIKLGSVDEELKFCRVRLRRAQLALEEWEFANLEGDEEEVKALNDLTEVIEEEGERTGVVDGVTDQFPFESKKKVRKRPDFEGIIHRYLQRIESLERTRKELGGGEDDLRSTARKFRDALAEIAGNVPEPPAEDETEETKK